MSEIELHHEQPASTLAMQMDYARAVSTASMLPENYRGKPADIMLAVGLGQSMGLSPAESLYRISVIKGKPTASAELIAANVRKAGHRLRVRGDESSCTATIIRADDPDYEFTVTRDLEWAERMGLARNDNYRKQAGTMLQWRAITAVARLACPEALYGVSYTPDELGDLGEQRQVSHSSSGLAAVLQTSGAEAAPEVPSPSEPAATSAPEPAPKKRAAKKTAAKPEGDPEPWETDLTDKTRGRMFALFAEQGINDRDEQIRGISHIIGRPIASRSELTEADAQKVVDVLAKRSGK